MSGTGGGRGERGSAIVETVAGTALLLLVVMAVWQSVVWLEQAGEAQADAAALARLSVLCPKPYHPPGLATVDAAAAGSAVEQSGDDGTVAVTVRLVPTVVVSGPLSLPSPSATVTMHEEPC